MQKTHMTLCGVWHVYLAFSSSVHWFLPIGGNNRLKQRFSFTSENTVTAPRPLHRCKNVATLAWNGHTHLHPTFCGVQISIRLSMSVMHTPHDVPRRLLAVSWRTWAHGKATAIGERLASFVTLFPSLRHPALICIRHLQLRMLNVAIKLIAGVKCICAPRVCNKTTFKAARLMLKSCLRRQREGGNIKRNVTGCGIIRQRNTFSTSYATYTQLARWRFVHSYTPAPSDHLFQSPGCASAHVTAIYTTLALSKCKSLCFWGAWGGIFSG